MLQDDMRYFQKRVREERYRVEAAADACARRAHACIAVGYERLVVRAETSELRRVVE